MEKQSNSNAPMDVVLMHIIDSMDAQVLVTDLLTDEILYTNQKMNDGYEIAYDPVGKPCYAVYENLQCRCDHCPVPLLLENPDAVIKWEKYDERTDKWFFNTDSVITWVDGRAAHLQHCADITIQKRRIKLQELITSLSQSFIFSTDTQYLIHDSLSQIGSALRAERAVIRRFDENNTRLTLVESWHEPSCPISAQVIDTPASIDTIVRIFQKESSPYISCANVEEAPDFAALSAHDIKSFLAVPLYTGNSLWGIFSLELCTRTSMAQDNTLQIGVMAGSLISGVLTREKMQQQMREAEERTQMMLDATPMACTFYDENCELIDCNEEATHMYGTRSKQEYIERFFDLSPEYQPDGKPSRETAVALLKSAFHTGYESFEWIHRKADGQCFPTEITLRRIRWRDKYRIAGYARDISQLKATMEKIEKTQAELVTALELAEESSAAKTNFLANMSHEIRTPMNVILGMTELAKKSDDMDSIKDRLSKIEDASQHLLGVINDILDMSKIGAGKFDLQPSDFPLERMLQQMCNVTHFKVDEKYQDFVIKIDKNVPPAIVSDEQRLAQLLTNLVSNAVKFTPEHGRIDLLIHNVEDHADSCKLLFEVIDTGIGIPPQNQQKLWSSFEQADGGISRKYGGTGLGLAISKNIIDMMGGDIGLESQLGKGSRFYFSIPVKKGNAPNYTQLSKSINWKNLRVLLVDDSPELCEYFMDMANTIGMNCTTVQSGDDALALIQNKVFDIIFVDWMMPGMGGVELAEKIHGQYGDGTIVIMISAYEWAEIEPDARKVGVTRFISKPLLPSAIIDCINGVLNADKSMPKEEPDAQTAGQFNGKHILLAEDYPINREIVKSMLAQTGIQIDMAENGVQAVELFTQHSDRYDLIFMDIHMPEMDGYTATKSIRALNVPYAKEVPIIAMTANVFKEDIEKCLAAGMNDHIGKPLGMKQLIDKLNEYLG